MARGADWIAVDWGTTNMRAWAMAGGDAVARLTSGAGMARLAPGQFEDALLAAVAPYLSGRATPVICCGMAGARQGWAEAPYAALPCPPPDATGATVAPARDPRLHVRILPGLSQERPADVMRGEETQIAGFLAASPGFDGVICLPGTHTKWVHVSAGEVISFRTFMTGELFALLAGQSVLRHGLTADGWDDTAFEAALSDAMAKPETIAAALFGLRAEGLLRGLAPAAARARLSGLLIGAEMAGARPYWLGRRVALVGAPALSARYEAALAAQGVEAETADAEEMTLAGLTAAWRRLNEGQA